jgi:predicted deacylase
MGKKYPLHYLNLSSRKRKDPGMYCLSWLYAPCDGTIEKILKKVVDDVEEGEVIATVA